MNNLSPDERLAHNCLVVCVKEHSAAVAREEMTLLKIQHYEKGYSREDYEKARRELERTKTNLLHAAMRWGAINTNEIQPE